MPSKLPGDRKGLGGIYLRGSRLPIPNIAPSSHVDGVAGVFRRQYHDGVLSEVQAVRSHWCWRPLVAGFEFHGPDSKMSEPRSTDVRLESLT
jgi:hypothetical protein